MPRRAADVDADQSCRGQRWQVHGCKRCAKVKKNGVRGEGVVVKSTQDLAAGLFLLALGAVGYFGSLDLSFGALNRIEAGFMPRMAALLVAGFGALLVVLSFTTDGAPLGRVHLREPLFILGAVLLFAWTIRPLGLAIAGPLAVMVSAFADRETRLGEVAVFAVVMTGLCILLFSVLLRLPIPILPSSLPYPFTALI